MTNEVLTGLRTRGGEPLLLEGVEASGNVKGGFLEMAVEQRFRNPTKANVEVVYTFPLPWRAVLLGVDVVLGERRLAGTVVPKADAEARYEETLSAGDAAVMLETNRDESYTLNLGNLAAGETCVVTLRYGQVLQFEQGGLRLLLPTVIAPRYGDPVRVGGLRPHQVTAPSLEVEYPFALRLQLHGELARARVASPSHPIAVALAEGVVTVTLARRGALDRDFVLVVDQLQHHSAAVIAADAAAPGTTAALVTFRPRVPATGPAPVAVNILVDCSGSMNGDSIRAASRALAEIVTGLADGDRFSLSRFGSTVEHRSRGLWKVAAASRAAAAAWLAGLEADLGGTEMEAALLSTFALAQTVRSDVLLITDGEIEAIDGAIDAAVAAGHRVFIVGIGASPAETHLRRLAEATGGACDFVAPGEAVGPAVLRMFARLRTSRLASCRIEWPAGTEVAWMSPLPTGVFDGDTVTVYAQLRQWTDGEVRLVGRRAQGETDETVAGAAIGAPGADTGNLARMVGAARVGQLLAIGEPTARKEAQDLAVAYQLVSAQTNFLLVHPRAEADRAKDMPELHAVRPMLAAGWGGVGTVQSAPAPMMMCFDDLAVPAVMRRGQSSIKICASMRSPVSGYDPGIRFSLPRVMEPAPDYDDGEIPAFLRKVEAEDASNRLRSAPYWSDGPDYRGFTPVGVCAYLDQTPPADHPCTYGDLLAVGVAGCVVDWLRQTFHEHNGAPVPETDVVAVFIYLMMSDDMLRQLGLPSGVRAAIGAATRRAKAALKGARKPQLASRLAALVDEMQRAVAGISAEHWPEAIEPAIG